MRVISETSLRTLESQIVASAHNLEMKDGSFKHLGTIDPVRLRQAALAAISIAAGEPVVTYKDLQDP